MQQATMGSDATKEYILKLEQEFHKLQLYAMEQAKENYLKTEFILESSVIHDSYCDYIRKLTINGIQDNYMSISKKDLRNQLNQYDVSDDEIEQYLAAPY